jgi:hypothetical protein
MQGPRLRVAGATVALAAPVEPQKLLQGWRRRRSCGCPLGRHGDTGTREQELLQAVLKGEVDAGAVGR